MIEALLGAIAGSLIPSAITLFVWMQQKKRDTTASHWRKNKAIEQAANSIAGEAFLVLHRPDEPIEKHTSNQDGSLKRRIRQHLEKAFDHV